MSKIEYCIVVSILAVTLSGCGYSDKDDDSSADKRCSLRGAAQFTTDGGDASSHNVKLAAISSRDDSVLSNVVNLGTAQKTDVAFDLDICLSKMPKPFFGELIVLSMWIDGNDNNVIDGDEVSVPVVPNGDCPVFENADCCGFMFEGEWSPLGGDYNGYWSIITGPDSSTELTNEMLTGAKIKSGTPVDM